MYNQRNAYSSPTVLGIEEKYERVLCYVLGWVSGLIFLLIERRNTAVRRHAYQSVVVFGALSIIGIGLGAVGVIVTIVGVLLWLLLMFLAFFSPETFIGAPHRELM